MCFKTVLFGFSVSLVQTYTMILFLSTRVIYYYIKLKQNYWIAGQYYNTSYPNSNKRECQNHFFQRTKFNIHQNETLIP